MNFFTHENDEAARARWIIENGTEVAWVYILNNRLDTLAAIRITKLPNGSNVYRGSGEVIRSGCAHSGRVVYEHGEIHLHIGPGGLVLPDNKLFAGSTLNITNFHLAEIPA